MSEPKTKPTNASATKYLNAVANATLRSDCRTLMKSMAKITGHKAKMWGPSIIGFGSYRYEYESGRTGTMPLIGFAPRGREIVLYIVPGFAPFKEELARLGKHRTGESCLYVKRLADIDTVVLETIMAKSVAAMRKRSATRA